MYTKYALRKKQTKLNSAFLNLEDPVMLLYIHSPLTWPLSLIGVFHKSL